MVQSEVETSFTAIATLSIGQTVKKDAEAREAVRNIWAKLPAKFKQQFSHYEGACQFLCIVYRREEIAK